MLGYFSASFSEASDQIDKNPRKGHFFDQASWGISNVRVARFSRESRNPGKGVVSERSLVSRGIGDVVAVQRERITHAVACTQCKDTSWANEHAVSCRSVHAVQGSSVHAMQ
jgi:hypothetical protein